MKFLATLQQQLGFTNSEIKVVLFLSAAFIAGLGIRWYDGATQKQGAIPPDYASADSEFTARSRSLASLGPSIAASPAAAPSAHRKPTLKDQSVNINTASAAQLIQLPGIGSSYAERIIAYRTEHKRFKNVNELGNVKGIGKKRLDQLRQFVTVGQNTK
jgi:comEA protein